VTPHPFAALVRRLDASATGAPWGGTSPLALRADGDTFGVAAFETTHDRAITRTLRNAAPEVAALVEAAAKLAASLFDAELYADDSADAHYDSGWGIKENVDQVAGALVALAVKAKEES